MPFEIESRHINGAVVVILPTVLGDERGFFMETYRADNFRAMGLPTDWVQDNHSRSAKGVLRGLHFQWEPRISKLMRVTHGAAYVMALDIRKGSPTLGQWYGVEASAENKKQVYAPWGFARGFCALTEGCEVQYKCTGIYNPKTEGCIAYADPALGIDWPISNPVVSGKDGKAPSLAEWLASPESENVTYAAR